MTLNTRSAAIVGALLAATAPTQALAWGHTGHVMVSRIAIQKLPAEVPDFVRTAQAAQQIGELGAEADVSKTTGLVTSGSYAGRDIRTTFAVHDGERDPGHYVDLNDDGTFLGTTAPIAAVPNAFVLPNFNSPGRRDYDSTLRLGSGTSVRVGNVTTVTTTSFYSNTQYFVGYLPFNIVDHAQQIRKDFAYIRAFTKAIATATTPDEKSFFQYQLGLRKTLTLRDIGYASHFIGDGSQPLHVSVHFNGWGPYPNPNNYTLAGIHGPFEGAYVKANVDFTAVAALVTDYVPTTLTFEERTVRYMKATLAQVEPMYQLPGAANVFSVADPASTAFAQVRLAAASTELRDIIVDAWRQSANVTVGFPLIKVSEIEAGTVLLTRDRFAGD